MSIRGFNSRKLNAPSVAGNSDQETTDSVIARITSSDSPNARVSTSGHCGN